MSAQTTLITPADLLKMPDGERHLELIRGVVRMRNKGTQASYVSGQILHSLATYANATNDWVFSWSLGYNCFRDEPNTVRHANATLIASSRFTREQLLNDEPFCDVSPDLVVEVIGTDDNSNDLLEAVGAWLGAGSRLVWILDPRSRAIPSHRSDGSIILHHASDILSAPELLPGFSCPIAELFRFPTRTATT